MLRVQASLALTEQQRAYLAQLRGVCLTALAGIIDERNAIHASLTVRALLDFLQCPLTAVAFSPSTIK